MVLEGAPVLPSPLPGTDAEQLRTAKFFGVSDHVNGMQPLEENTALFRLGYQIDRVRAGVDCAPPKSVSLALKVIASLAQPRNDRQDSTSLGAKLGESDW